MNKKLTPVKAIRFKCLDCCVGQISEVRLCPVKTCPIYPYRMGKRPQNVEITIQKKRNKGIVTGGST